MTRVAYIMIFKKEFARDPQKAEEKRKPKELAQRQEEAAAQQGRVVVSPASDYKDQVHHLICKGAAKDAAHMLQATRPMASPWPTRGHERDPGQEAPAAEREELSLTS